MVKSRKFLLIICASIIISLFLIFMLYSFTQEVKRPKLPVLGKVGNFQLTDSFGQVFESTALRGKVWIASFFFTTCGDVCPITTKNMAALNRTFEKVPAVFLVSITVNPEYDTAKRLHEFANQQKIDQKKWHFLTGPRQDIKRILVEEFKVGSAEEPVFHSTYFPLVDRYGNIRGYYDGVKQEEINRLFKDAAMLVKER